MRLAKYLTLRSLLVCAVLAVSSNAQADPVTLSLDGTPISFVSMTCASSLYDECFTLVTPTNTSGVTNVSGVTIAPTSTTLTSFNIYDPRIPGATNGTTTFAMSLTNLTITNTTSGAVTLTLGFSDTSGFLGNNGGTGTDGLHEGGKLSPTTPGATAALTSAFNGTTVGTVSTSTVLGTFSASAPTGSVTGCTSEFCTNVFADTFVLTTLAAGHSLIITSSLNDCTFTGTDSCTANYLTEPGLTVPEPASALLLGLGLVGLFTYRRMEARRT